MTLADAFILGFACGSALVLLLIALHWCMMRYEERGM